MPEEVTMVWMLGTFYSQPQTTIWEMPNQQCLQLFTTGRIDLDLYMQTSALTEIVLSFSILTLPNFLICIQPETLLILLGQPCRIAEPMPTHDCFPTNMHTESQCIFCPWPPKFLLCQVHCLGSPVPLSQLPP
jgi:hypothetical protein